MKDAIGREISNANDTIENTSPALALAVDDDVKDANDGFNDLKALVSRYVQQILHGCDSSACKQPLCATGRRNDSSRRPLRQYNARSARTLATNIASGPNPRAHLCAQPKGIDHAEPKIEGPRDPAAFTQKLSDTASITTLSDVPRGLTRYDDPLHLGRTSKDHGNTSKRLEYWHNRLGRLSETGDSHESDGFDANVAVDTLYECLQWLRGPCQGTRYWRIIADLIKTGKSTYHHGRNGEAGSTNPEETLDSLDRLTDARLLRLLYHILAVLAHARTHLIAERPSSGHILPNGISVEDDLSERLVARIIVSEQPAMAIDVVVWLQMAFLKTWDGVTSIVNGTVTSEALVMLEYMSEQYNLDPAEREPVFSIPAVSARLDADLMARSYMETGNCGGRHLLTFHFLFKTSEILIYFRMMNHLTMYGAHSDSQKAMATRIRYQHPTHPQLADRLKYLEEHYLLLNVSRGNVLQDSFDQLWRRRRGELLRPLRVRLGQVDELEIGHDLGGVQIEFFNLIVRELFDEQTQMFTTDPETGLSYFRPGSLQPLYMFRLCGLLFGLAVHNGITLPVNFPRAMYNGILERHTYDPFDLISDGWPSITRSLRSIREEVVPDMEATLPFEANGLRLSILQPSTPFKLSQRVVLQVTNASQAVHHAAQKGNITAPVDIESLALAWPGWHLTKAQGQPPELTEENVDAYVNKYIYWLAHGSVGPQLHAFLEGFFSVVDRKSLTVLSPHHLQTILEGSDRLDINDLRDATAYTDYDANSEYIRNFWRLVISWPETKQKQLLKFVTAIERMPAGGAGNFSFKIERAEPNNTDKLPTSSTCFRTLFLPEYSSTESLDAKLTLAFNYGLEGFGSG